MKFMKLLAFLFAIVLALIALKFVVGVVATVLQLAVVICLAAGAITLGRFFFRRR